MGGSSSQPKTRRVVRALIVASLVASVVGLGSELNVPRHRRSFVTHDTAELAGVLGECPACPHRYGIYTSLRELAAGSQIVLPQTHPLDETALGMLALLDVQPTRESSLQLAAPITWLDQSPSRSGWFEDSISAPGTFWRYEIFLDANADPGLLQLLIADDTLIVGPLRHD